jgi:hypothetical protein
MAAKKSSSGKNVRGEGNTEEVDEFMSRLEHPLKEEIEVIRALILDAHSGITESIKWNAPSFYFRDYFATFHLRAKKGVQIILHRGAKVKAGDPEEITIHDEAGLLTWLASDRCSIQFYNKKDVIDNRAAFQSIINQWITFLR